MLATIETLRAELLRVAEELKARVTTAKCYHCGETIPLAEGGEHWRTCAKHPARLEIERLRDLLRRCAAHHLPGCGHEPAEPHTCSFAEEINNNHEALCTCCEVCTEQCAEDI